MGWRRFVAIGDSFTEGLDDRHPNGVDYRGWADLVASRLAADGDCHYANLAVRGRLLESIITEQVPVALRMRPDLVSFAGGGNDALRRDFDSDLLVQTFGEAVRQVRAIGADIILFRFADITVRLPGRRMIAPRMEALHQAVSDIAATHGAILVDLWGDDEFRNPLLWSDDRLHLAPVGHRRVAAHVLVALGVAPPSGWFDAPESPRMGWVAARGQDVRWVGQHLAPWIARRLVGRSSGDTVVAKRPELTPADAIQGG